MERARRAVAEGLGLGLEEGEEAQGGGGGGAVVSEELVMGLFYSCQTDASLLAFHARGEGDGSPESEAAHPHHRHHESFLEARLRAHDARLAAHTHLGGAGSLGTASWACGLLPGELLEAMEAAEDRENYHTRGFGAAASR